jgi:hypothetical protein
MPTGTHGFGSIHVPGQSDPDSMPIPEVAPDPAVASSDYLRRIAEKYDGQPVEDITIFNLAAGKAVKIDFSQTPFSSFTVSVTTGTVKVMFGDYTQQAAQTLTGHFQAPSGGAPFQWIGATLGRIITLVNDPAAATNAIGCLIISRP